MAGQLLIGAIADDLTGAVELAGVLAAGGARTVLAVGAGAVPASASDLDAVVVALRSRVAPPGEALAAMDYAAAALDALGARQLFFKYCATFDSTDQGNIGNCAELLAGRRGSRSVLFTPSFPEADRTVYRGHLFVGDRLLADSPKRFDPLTPMTRSDLVQVLAPQTRLGVGLLPWSVVQSGPAAIRRHAAERAAAGTPFLVADAITDADLAVIARASWDWPVSTGGSTVLTAYPAIWRENGLLAEAVEEPAIRLPGPAAVLAGSCAERTREQIAAFAQSHPVLHLDILAPEEESVAAGIDWAAPRLPAGPVCIATSTDPEAVARAQAALGAIAAGRRAEALLGRLACALVERGVRRLLVAGGETSGAVVEALGISELRVAPYRALGLGHCRASAPVPLALCLKSGKLGAVDMFARSLEEMGSMA